MGLSSGRSTRTRRVQQTYTSAREYVWLDVHDAKKVSPLWIHRGALNSPPPSTPSNRLTPTPVIERAYTNLDDQHPNTALHWHVVPSILRTASNTKRRLPAWSTVNVQGQSNRILRQVQYNHHASPRFQHSGKDLTHGSDG